MIRKTFSEEFMRDGVEVVREKVARRAYKDNEKHEQAIKWLDQGDPARKTYSAARKTYGAAKKQLTLARRAAREQVLAKRLPPTPPIDPGPSQQFAEAGPNGGPSVPK